MLDKKILIELQEYIESNLNVIEVFEELQSIDYSLKEELIEIEIDDFINKHRKPTMRELLFTYIDRKEVRDPEVYKKAGIDRKHFSKIRSNPDYHPKKNTVISLALALELNLDETDEFLESAGFSLSDSDTSDLIIRYFIQKNKYDLDDVNEALISFYRKPIT